MNETFYPATQFGNIYSDDIKGTHYHWSFHFQNLNSKKTLRIVYSKDWAWFSWWGVSKIYSYRSAYYTHYFCFCLQNANSKIWKLFFLGIEIWKLIFTGFGPSYPIPLSAVIRKSCFVAQVDESRSVRQYSGLCVRSCRFAVGLLQSYACFLHPAGSCVCQERFYNRTIEISVRRVGISATRRLLTATLTDPLLQKTLGSELYRVTVSLHVSVSDQRLSPFSRETQFFHLYPKRRLKTQQMLFIHPYGPGPGTWLLFVMIAFIVWSVGAWTEYDIDIDWYWVKTDKKLSYRRETALQPV